MYFGFPQYYFMTTTTTTPQVELHAADAGKLQDAWHYATLILHRSDSSFDGSRGYPAGIRGQMKAYEDLLGKIDEMAADNDTWQLVKTNWWEPSDWYWMNRFTEEMMGAINRAAAKLGIDARTGCKPENI
jgi:hypothetical protein